MRRTTLAALLLLALPACASPQAPAAAPPELTADAIETRAARSQAKVSISLANPGDRPVEVERLHLRSPLFAELPPTPRKVRMAPGASSGRLFLAYGEPRCDVDAPLDAVLVAGVRTDGGTTEVEVPVTDRSPGLARLHELACAARAVTQEVAVELGAQGERVVEDGVVTLRTALRLTRRGTEPVTVTRLGGNVLFTLEAPAREPLVTLAAGEQEASVQVDVLASRCDPHALTESKKELVFTFSLFARLDGGEEVQVPLVVPESGRPAVLELLREVCIAPLEARTVTAP